MKNWLICLLLISGIWAQDPDFILEGKAANILPLGFKAFVPMAGESQTLPVDPGEIIADDLEFSGRVKILEILKNDSSSLKYLLMNETYAYVWGEFKYTDNNIALNCYLTDVETGDAIVAKKYSGTVRQLRQMAHKFSDELVYQLFGEKGIAQTKVVFVSKQSGSKEIYIMDYDGANSQKVTKGGHLNLTPAWLQDNAHIMYTSYRNGTPQLYKHDLKTGKSLIFLKSKYMNVSPDYNYVDGEIIYTSSVKGNTEIFRVREDGTDPTRLTFSNSLETSASWSPNGYEIAFTSSRSGNPNIYIMDRDGSNIRRLTYEGKYNTSPAWSPSGDKIAFCSMGEGGRMNIFTISPTGSDLRRLTDASGSDESPSWSPDGRAIVFSSNRLGRSELYHMRADGSNQKRLTNFGGNTSPSWSHF